MDKEVSGNENELFYLKWHNFQKNVSKQFERLREDDDLVDITFACEGKQIRAHKLVLFACSPYFKHILKVSKAEYLMVCGICCVGPILEILIILIIIIQ